MAKNKATYRIFDTSIKKYLSSNGYKPKTTWFSSFWVLKAIEALNLNEEQLTYIEVHVSPVSEAIKIPLNKFKDAL